MAEEIGFKLTVDAGNSAQTVKSFKQELKEAKDEAIQMARDFGELSPQAMKAAQAFGKLKDEIEDANELSNALTNEKKYTAFLGLAGSIAGGFSAAQGAIALATGGGKQFEEAMLRVQSAMALASGLSQISDISRQWGVAKAALMQFTLVQKVNTAATAAATAIQKLFTGSVAATSTGFKVLKGAIIGTGIGLLVVAIGYAVSNFDKLKATVLNLIPGLATIADFIGSIVTAVTDFVGITSDAARETEKLRNVITGSNDVYEKQIQLLEASGAESAKVRALKNAMYDDEIVRLEQIQQLGETLTDDERKRFKELQHNKKILQAEATKEANALADEASKKAAEASKKATDEAKQKAKQDAADKKKAAEDAQKADDEAKQKVIDSLKELNAFELALLKAKGEEATGVRERQIDAEVELLRASGPKYAEEIIKLEREKVLVAAQAKTDAETLQKEKEAEAKVKAEELKLEQEAIAYEILKEGEAKELEALEIKYERMREVVKGNEELTTALVAAEAEAQAVIKKKFADIEVENKRQQADQLAGILGGASAIIGKSTVVGKGLAVAEATIQTYLGASKAISASAGMGPWGVALGIANAALVVANGIMSVKKIVSTKVPAPGGDGGGGGGSIAPTPAVATGPTLSGTVSTLVDQTQKIAENKDAMKAYVVESEITQKQERQKAITQTANF